MTSSFTSQALFLPLHHHHDPDLWTEHCHVTQSVTIETAVCLYVNISMTSNLSILSLCASLSLPPSQPVTPPAGNLTSKQRALLTFDPCMFRRPREADWCYHRERDREHGWEETWMTVDLKSKCAKIGETTVYHLILYYFLNRSLLFVLCVCVCVCMQCFQTRLRHQPDSCRTVKRLVCSRR